MSGENATSAMEKTLGQVGYEAHVAASESTQRMAWGDLTEPARAMWETAAQAVLTAEMERIRAKILYAAKALRARALVVLYQATTDNPTVHKASMEALYAARTILAMSDQQLQHIALHRPSEAQLAAWAKASNAPEEEALGQQMYEAFLHHIAARDPGIDDKASMKWEEMPPDVRGRWQALAAAVRT